MCVCVGVGVGVCAPWSFYFSHIEVDPQELYLTHLVETQFGIGKS